eukprot:gene8986-16123_t
MESLEPFYPERMAFRVPRPQIMNPKPHFAPFHPEHMAFRIPRPQIMNPKSHLPPSIQVSGKPIKFVGVGEKMESLEPFYPERISFRIPRPQIMNPKSHLPPSIQVSGKPIKFVGVGEKMESLEPFYPERMASRILGKGDMMTLYEKAEAAITADDAEAQMNRIMSANFDFNDFLKQWQSINNMGVQISEKELYEAEEAFEF